MLPRLSAIVISAVTAALSLAVWAIFGVVVLIWTLMVAAACLLLGAKIFEHKFPAVRLHAPYILCLMGVVFSLIYAFENARLETTRFWITLEKASVISTGVLSICYWVIEFFIPDETARSLTKKTIPPLAVIVAVGAAFLLFSSSLPYTLLFLFAGRDQLMGLPPNAIQVVYLQQLLIVCGSLLFALNSGVLLNKTHMNDGVREHDKFFSEKQKAWIFFFL